jgi:hypothetical protein
MTCRGCGNNRIAVVSAKASDMCFYRVGDQERELYTPGSVGLGGGDYVEFNYCLDCGCIQSDDFPVSQETVDDVFHEEL